MWLIGLLWYNWAILPPAGCIISSLVLLLMTSRVVWTLRWVIAVVNVPPLTWANSLLCHLSDMPGCCHCYQHAGQCCTGIPSRYPWQHCACWSFEGITCDHTTWGGAWDHGGCVVMWYGVTCCGCGHQTGCMTALYKLVGSLQFVWTLVIVTLDKTSEINYELLQPPIFTSSYLQTDHKVWMLWETYYMLAFQGGREENWHVTFSLNSWIKLLNWYTFHNLISLRMWDPEFDIIKLIVNRYVYVSVCLYMCKCNCTPITFNLIITASWSAWFVTVK